MTSAEKLYTYDGLHRLMTMDRGELNATKSGITGTPSREEDWSLDPLGNWSNFVQKTSGTTGLDQDRSVNKVNEITDITESTGPSWVTPAYDRNGNMTTIPKPADPTASFTATYDAWNRMVRIEQEVVGPVTIKVAEYAYDGLMRRTEKATFTAGVLAATRHFYYTSRWQAIEERLDSSTSPDRQFIWGPLYIDHLILRDRDTSVPPNGTLDERLYALQDANWNVTALADTNGGAVERYLYDTYGTPTVLTGDFASRTQSDYDWDRLFAGYSIDTTTELYVVRFRYLHCQLGTWCIRDTTVSPDDNGYEYVFSRPLRFVDPLGLQGTNPNNASLVPFVPGIRITEVRKSGCIDVAFKVKFEIPRRITSGFIVQEISSSTRVYDCDGRDITWRIEGTQPTRYWEAFDIAHIRLRSRVEDPDDTFSIAAPFQGTRGRHQVRGIAKGAGNVTLPEGFAVGVVPEAVELPATYNKPAGWDHLPGVEHNMTVIWDCCCDKKCLLVYTTPSWAIDLPFGPGVDPSCPEQIPTYR